MPSQPPPCGDDYGHSRDYREPLTPAEYRWHAVHGRRAVPLCGQHYGYWIDRFSNDRDMRPVAVDVWVGKLVRRRWWFDRFIPWQRVWDADPYKHKGNFIPEPPPDNGSGIRTRL